jgi:superfamily II DNA helicase RecQ
MPGCKPCVLNHQSNKNALLEKIKTGEYSHGIELQSIVAHCISQLTRLVLLSPEIALSEKFKTKVLYDQAFRDHLVLVAVDEIHVVSQWGQHWRKPYSRLSLLRDIIGKSVPWLGCSATLDPVTLLEVRDLCGFSPSVRIQRVSTDRPDITFAIQPIQYTMHSFRDLEFLVEPVYAAVKQVVAQRRESMVKEVLKEEGEVAAQAALARTRLQKMKQVLTAVLVAK